MPVTRLFQNAPLTPEVEVEICSILNREQGCEFERICLKDRELERSRKGSKVNTPMWLTSSMPASAGRRHRESQTVEPQSITPTERDRKQSRKVPFKFSPLKIKIPSRPDLPSPIANSDTEYTMDSDRESSLEMLKPRRSRSSESDSMEMLSQKRVIRPARKTSKQTGNAETLKNSDESDSVSVGWFSYAVHETDDSLFSPSSKTETYSTRELRHTNCENYKSLYGDMENESGEDTLTADNHIWNPSGRRGSGSTGHSSTRSFSICKTPIVREKTSPTTSDPDHILSLKETRSSREEKEELSRSYSRSSTRRIAPNLHSPSLIPIARLSAVVRSPASIRTPSSLEYAYEEQSTGSSTRSYYQQKINSRKVTSEMTRMSRRTQRGSRVPRSMVI